MSGSSAPPQRLLRRLGVASCGLAVLVAIVSLVAVPPSYGDSLGPQRAAGPGKLQVTIDTVSPAALRPGDELQLTGTVTNPDKIEWLDAQVYLLISPDPATTLDGLQQFAAVPDDVGFGTTIVTFGLFDQIGDLPPGAESGYVLTIPYDQLPISGAPGVYHVGVSVLAGTRQGRDINSDGRADTLVPLLPKTPPARSAKSVVLLPITAPVKRLPDGAFLDDTLAHSLAFGGRLRNLLSFAQAAPPKSVQVVIDPAVLAAIQAMSQGYVVRSLADVAAGTKGTPGTGRADAVTWLADWRELRARTTVLMLPWGAPAVNSLVSHRLGGVARAGVAASRHYASITRLNALVAGWQATSRTTPRSLTLLQRAGTTLQILSPANLPDLQPAAGRSTPPSVVSIPRPHGSVPVLVASRSLAGQHVTHSTTALQLRQELVADATVRALSGIAHPGLTVLGLPFNWNPGPGAAGVGLDAAFRLPVLAGRLATKVVSHGSVDYTGTVRAPVTRQPGLSSDLFAAIRRLRGTGTTFSSILSGSDRAGITFQRHLAESGSNAWRWAPFLGISLTNAQADADARKIRHVTVTGPPFVAMSSNSGRFAITVSNGLRSEVTVRLDVTAQDPALRFGPLDKVVLAPGQRRDIQVIGTAKGSGITAVQAQLATPQGHPFGKPWRFDVRTTEIGLVIWGVMGVGAAVLFVTAGFRIVRRIRGGWRRRGAEG